MTCPGTSSPPSCRWCSTDRLVASCPSSLISAIEDYCRLKGKTEWFFVCQHLGGDCGACLSAILAMCEKGLRQCPYPPRDWEADDLSQALFTRIVPSQWEPVRGPLGGWLSVIIRNLIIDIIQSAHNQHPFAPLATGDDNEGLVRVPADSRSEDPSEAVERLDTRERVRRAIEALPFELRQVVWLRAHGHKFKEICEALQIPLVRAARNLEKAMSMLREELADLNDGESPPLREGGES